MPAGDVEVYYEGDGWHVRIEATQATDGPFDTKDEAITVARDIAREAGVEVITGNQDATHSEPGTHDPDPRSIPG